MPKVICNKYKDCENIDWCNHSVPHDLEKYICSDDSISFCHGQCDKESHLRYIRSNKINKINENTEESI